MKESHKHSFCGCLLGSLVLENTAFTNLKISSSQLPLSYKLLGLYYIVVYRHTDSLYLNERY